MITDFAEAVKQSSEILATRGHIIFDYALVNATPASAELKLKYAEEHARQIVADVDGIEALGVNVILGDYLEEVDGVARHATDRVSRDLLRLPRHAVRKEDDAA